MARSVITLIVYSSSLRVEGSASLEGVFEAVRC
jgi:hypothetical protein